MAKILHSVAAVALMLPASIAAQDGTPLQFVPDSDPALISTERPAPIKIKSLNEAMATQAIISTKAIDTSGWIVAEGDWQYLSRYTGKTYPTEVKYKYATDDDGNPTGFASMELTNEFFGTIYLGTDLITGDTSSRYDYDENDNAIYPRLNDENGDPTDTTISISFEGNEQGYGSWGAYPLSGKARLFARYIPLVDGDPSYSSGLCLYDYLYNTQAKDCKIKADYAKGYYHGENTAKVSLQKGEGVTDVYYIMGQKIIDEKRTQADPLWHEDQGYCYYTLSRSLVGEYIAEYKAGESNDAYIVGHVDDNATEFEMPLPDNDGITRMFIVAYSGDQITDMAFDMIEVRRPCEWRNYGSVYITNDINWGSSGGQTYDLINSGTYPIEVNADGTLYRIAKPFATDKNQDANYLYINAALGIDHCYIESSYTPVEHYYNYTDLSGNTQVITRPYLMQDIASANILNGAKPQTLEPYFFFDFSSGISKISLMLIRDYNTQLYGEYAGVLYVMFSAYGKLGFKLDNAVTATPDTRWVNFETGSAVDHLLCTFGYDAAPSEIHPASTGNDEPSFRIDIEDGKGSIDIHTLLKDKKIPQSPTHIYYTAFDISDNVLRTGDLDLTGIDFSKASAYGNVQYVDHTYFSDSQLMIVREDNQDTGTTTFTVKDINSTMEYADTSTDISFDVKDNVLTKGIDSFYVNTLNFTNYGNLDVYAVFDNMEYSVTSDSATLTGDVYYFCYDPDTHDYVGYAAASSFTITIPGELLYEIAGIDGDIVADDNNAGPVYYNLQGIRVDNPAPGSIFIEVKGQSTRKIIYK